MGKGIVILVGRATIKVRAERVATVLARFHPTAPKKYQQENLGPWMHKMFLNVFGEFSVPVLSAWYQQPITNASGHFITKEVMPPVYVSEFEITSQMKGAVASKSYLRFFNEEEFMKELMDADFVVCEHRERMVAPNVLSGTDVDDGWVRNRWKNDLGQILMEMGGDRRITYTVHVDYQ